MTSLENALDGLLDAVEYAEQINEDQLADELSELYQRVADKAPDDHWNRLQAYQLRSDDLMEIQEQFDIVVTKKTSTEAVVYLTRQQKERIQERYDVDIR